MTDKRELLELAARAAGYEVWFPRMNGGKYQDGNRVILEPCHMKKASGEIVEWDPTESDGDGGRLEERLSLSPEWWETHVFCTRQGRVFFPAEKYADHNNNRQAARKWASTRAAAEVGRGMKP